MLSRISRGLLAAAFACVCAAVAAAPCAAQTVTWTGAGDGIHWTQAANWSSTPALPGPNNDVVIGPGPGTIVLNAPASVRSLTCARNLTVNSSVALTLAQDSTIGGTFTLAGSSTLTGAGNVTLTGTFSWTSGIMSGTGRTIVASGATLTMLDAALKDLRRPFDIQGAAIWTGGLLKVTGATISNSGTFTAGAATGLSVTVGGGTNAFHNTGTFVKVGLSSVLFPTGVPFNNGGTVNVQQGLFRLEGGGSHAGAFTGSVSGGMLVLLGTHQLQAGGAFGGLLDVQVQSGSCSIAGAVSPRKLTQFGGTLTAGGPITATTVQITSGTATFAGHVTSSIRTDGGQATFNGPVTAPSLETSGGTVTFNGPVTATTLVLGTSPTFNGATSVVNATLQSGLLGTGDVSISGSLDWVAGGMRGTGKTTVAAGATMTLRAGGLYRLLECAGAASWGTTGFGIHSPGILRIMPGGTFNASGQTISNFESPGTIDVRGAMTKTGGITTTLQCRLTNTGSFTVATGTLVLGGETTNLDAATGTLSGGSWTLGNGATFSYPAGPGIRTLAAGTAVTLTGPTISWGGLQSLRTVNGSLTLGAGMQWSLNGAIDAFTNNGRIRLEAGSCLSMGPYVQGPSGVLSVAYLGPSVQQHGRLQFGVNVLSNPGAALNGQLEVTSLVSPPGCLDHVRPVFGGRALTGQFAQLTLPSRPAGSPQWRIRYEPLAVRLTRTIRVDLDDNDRIEPADVAAFTAAWFANLTGGGLGADFDGDGVIAPADVSLFVVQWFDAAGVCNSGN